MSCQHSLDPTGRICKDYLFSWLRTASLQGTLLCLDWRDRTQGLPIRSAFGGHRGERRRRDHNGVSKTWNSDYLFASTWKLHSADTQATLSCIALLLQHVAMHSQAMVSAPLVGDLPPSYAIRCLALFVRYSAYPECCAIRSDDYCLLSVCES